MVKMLNMFFSRALKYTENAQCILTYRKLCYVILSQLLYNGLYNPKIQNKISYNRRMIKIVAEYYQYYSFLP